MPESGRSIHWEDCWRIHHSCAIALLEQLLNSPQWQTECQEFGCHDVDVLSKNTAGKSDTP